MTSIFARRHGISTAEQRRRGVDARQCYAMYQKIGDGEKLHICMGAIRWGLSERAFEERDRLAGEKCDVYKNTELSQSLGLKAAVLFKKYHVGSAVTCIVCQIRL